MEEIKLDAFNPEAFENYVPETEVVANKNSFNLILGVIVAVAIGLVLYKVHELNRENNAELNR